MQREEEGAEVAKWVTHYSSNHSILLVGEGDFSFSLCLARSFGSAANIVASSLDSYDDVTKKYKHAKSNLDDLQNLGACLLHQVDATKMKFHSDLKMLRFDRIIFNFPHAGFYRREDDKIMIKMHMELVFGFFKNASALLRSNGEVHVNHKTGAPFSHWNIEKLAVENFLTLIECVEFRKEDYPGYNNKRGDGCRCDKSFPLGKCSTFKFIYNSRALKNHQRIDHMASRQQSDLPFQGIQEAVEQSPTSVDLSYCHQTSRISICGVSLSNGAILLLVVAILVAYSRVASCASYSAHGMIPNSQKLLQPLQRMQSLQSFQPNGSFDVVEKDNCDS